MSDDGDSPKTTTHDAVSTSATSSAFSTLIVVVVLLAVFGVVALVGLLSGFSVAHGRRPLKRGGCSFVSTSPKRRETSPSWRARRRCRDAS